MLMDDGRIEINACKKEKKVSQDQKEITFQSVVTLSEGMRERTSKRESGYNGVLLSVCFPNGRMKMEHTQLAKSERETVNVLVQSEQKA